MYCIEKEINVSFPRSISMITLVDFGILLERETQVKQTHDNLQENKGQYTLGNLFNHHHLSLFSKKTFDILCDNKVLKKKAIRIFHKTKRVLSYLIKSLSKYKLSSFVTGIDILTIYSFGIKVCN